MLEPVQIIFLEDS